MSTQCITIEVASNNARPNPCFPNDLNEDQCFGYIPQTECGVLISDSSSEEARTAAELHLSPDVLSEEDAFRFLIAKTIADKEIARSHGIIERVFAMFGSVDTDRAIKERALFNARNYYEYLSMEAEREKLDLNALRNRARQFVARAEERVVSDNKAMPLSEPVKRHCSDLSLFDGCGSPDESDLCKECSGVGKVPY